MKTSLPTLFAAAGLLLGATTASAHHSLAGEFDTATDIEIRGAVTKVEWFNPHIWIYLDVTNADGQIEKWQCEMGSPNQLIRAGWKKEDLPVGTVIKGAANPARDGSNTCSTRAITFDDGTPLFTRNGPQ
ncbi:MAG: hypothetical protein LBE21_01300 [Pseudomonadales bacterium]|jgi:hypothetical protein|nr:hypothetical protein [Pseudomonadales bacterium]